jgi:hypothetical protein
MYLIGINVVLNSILKKQVFFSLVMIITKFLSYNEMKDNHLMGLSSIMTLNFMEREKKRKFEEE